MPLGRTVLHPNDGNELRDLVSNPLMLTKPPMDWKRLAKSQHYSPLSTFLQSYNVPQSIFLKEFLACFHCFLGTFHTEYPSPFSPPAKPPTKIVRHGLGRETAMPKKKGVKPHKGRVSETNRPQARVAHNLLEILQSIGPASASRRWPRPQAPSKDVVACTRYARVVPVLFTNYLVQGLGPRIPSHALVCTEIPPLQERAFVEYGGCLWQVHFPCKYLLACSSISCTSISHFIATARGPTNHPTACTHYVHKSNLFASPPMHTTMSKHVVIDP